MTYLILNKGIQKNKLKPFFIFFIKNYFMPRLLAFEQTLFNVQRVPVSQQAL